MYRYHKHLRNVPFFIFSMVWGGADDHHSVIMACGVEPLSFFCSPPVFSSTLVFCPPFYFVHRFFMFPAPFSFYSPRTFRILILFPHTDLIFLSHLHRKEIYRKFGIDFHMFLHASHFHHLSSALGLNSSANFQSSN
jgi:hypothetical protein